MSKQEKEDITKSDVIERFLRYVKIDTQSNEESNTTPSTKKQFDLAKVLKKECEELGLTDIELDEKCYLFATLKSNIKDKDSKNKIPVVGFLAHLDTSCASPGNNIQHIIHRNYDGKDLILNKEKGLKIRVDNYPILKKYVGQDIITSDGTTLLGSDDKAGVAAIMSSMKELVNNADKIKHGDIRIGFTPDEEIGMGTEYFDVQKFGATYAYTIDGGIIGEISYETFNACTATLTVNGLNIHPGDAKNKMVNAISCVIEFENALPFYEKPQFTEKKEGYLHMFSIEGGVEKCTAKYLIRDHSKEKFEEKKAMMEKICEEMNEKYQKCGHKVMNLELKDSYYNMKEKIEPVFDPVVKIAIESMKECGIEPLEEPIRGGTDGARLSFEGLPCPNIFSGGHNFHAKNEFVPCQSIEKSKETILKIIENFAKKFM